MKIPSLYNKLIKNKYVLDEEDDDRKVLDIDYKIIVTEEDLAIDSDIDVEQVIDSSGRAVYDIQEIRKDIEKSVVKEIENERRKILTLAQEEGEEIKEDAKKIGYDAGYYKALEEGYEAGINKANEEMKAAKENALDLMDQAELMVNEYVVENEKSIIRLAVNMAESIVGFSIDENSYGILNLVKPVIAEYSKKEKMLITCNPARYDFLKSNLQELEDVSPDTKFFIFKDENLDLNDCIIESEDQFIDLGIKCQLQSIINTIKHME